MTLELSGAAYRYPGGARVGPVDLAVGAGEIVLVTGPTGCGKSTVLRAAAGLSQRHGQGDSQGVIRIGGRDPAQMSPAERVQCVGFVAQDPADQILTGTLGDEVAFGLESAGWPAEAIEARVLETLVELGFSGESERGTHQLSGGQRQRLIVAAALAGGARLLLLDEPLAHLDPGAVVELVAQLRRVREAGVSVVLVEHRLEPVWDLVDRVVVMADGRIVSDGVRAEVSMELLDSLGLAVPGRLALRDPAAPPPAGPAVLSAEGLHHSYGARPALRGVSVVARAGERIALLGANGSGKSTLISLLAGSLRTRGQRIEAGRVLDVPQDPDLALFGATVREELAYGPVEAGLGLDAVAERVERAAKALSISDLLERPPQALSRGQRLRTAVAAALTCEPAVLLLDEPTAGQDRDQVERMMSALREVFRERVLLFATHDVDLARRHATRVILLDQGAVVSDGAVSLLDVA